MALVKSTKPSSASFDTPEFDLPVDREFHALPPDVNLQEYCTVGSTRNSENYFRKVSRPKKNVWLEKSLKNSSSEHRCRGQGPTFLPAKMETRLRSLLPLGGNLLAMNSPDVRQPIPN